MRFCSGVLDLKISEGYMERPKGVLMAKSVKKKVRRDWTKNEVRTLMSLAKTKIGVQKISRKLKRSPAAVAFKASALKISLSTR
jgi:hypothetical protein